MKNLQIMICNLDGDDDGEDVSCEDGGEVRYHIVARSHKEAEAGQSSSCLSSVATKHQHQGLPRGVGTTRRGYTNPLSWDTGVGIAPLTGCWYHSTDAFTMGSNCVTKICIYAASVFKPNNYFYLIFKPQTFLAFVKVDCFSNKINISVNFSTM